MSTYLEEAYTWAKINSEARSKKKVMVKNGPTYAWARWSTALKSWVYAIPGDEERLDFWPTEYRVN